MYNCTFSYLFSTMTQNRHFHVCIKKQAWREHSNLSEVSQLWWERNLCPGGLPPSKGFFSLHYTASLSFDFEFGESTWLVGAGCVSEWRRLDAGVGALSAPPSSALSPGRCNAGWWPPPAALFSREAPVSYHSSQGLHLGNLTWDGQRALVLRTGAPSAPHNSAPTLRRERLSLGALQQFSSFSTLQFVWNQ